MISFLHRITALLFLMAMGSSLMAAVHKETISMAAAREILPRACHSYDRFPDFRAAQRRKRWWEFLLGEDFIRLRELCPSGLGDSDSAVGMAIQKLKKPYFCFHNAHVLCDMKNEKVLEVQMSSPVTGLMTNSEEACEAICRDLRRTFGMSMPRMAPGDGMRSVWYNGSTVTGNVVRLYEEDNFNLRISVFRLAVPGRENFICLKAVQTRVAAKNKDVEVITEGL